MQFQKSNQLLRLPITSKSNPQNLISLITFRHYGDIKPAIRNLLLIRHYFTQINFMSILRFSFKLIFKL